MQDTRALRPFLAVLYVPEFGYYLDPNAEPAPRQMQKDGNAPRGLPPFLVPDERNERVEVKRVSLDSSWIDRFLLLNSADSISILKFANKWGWLGPCESVSSRSRLTVGEGLNLWGEEIAAAKDILSLWEDVKKQRLLKRTAAALTKIQTTVNSKLEGQIHARLLRNGSTLASALVMKHLQATVWFQIHESIAGERRIIRCGVCKEWMDVTGYTARKVMHDRCSRNQRQAKWRKEVGKL